MTALSRTLARPPEQLVADFSALRWRRDVAALLEIPETLLIYYLHQAPPRLRYKTFQIRKKSGGARQISAPDNDLKRIQSKLAQVLQSIYQPRPAAHGFIPRRGIVTNAAEHARSRHVFNVDLEDFFPSINFGRVRGMFIAWPYNLPKEAATVLAQLCTHENILPQGAPTSPIVSNMICSRLDSDLQKLARTYYCRYSRYADDITFSKSSHMFPREISRVSATGVAAVGDRLRRAIEANGFRINESKVRHQTRKNRQVVTGLVVNRKINVPRTFIRNIRAAIHAYKKFGEENAQRFFAEKYDKPYRIAARTSPRLLNVLRGKIEFVGMVKGTGDKTYKNLQRQYTEINPDYVSFKPQEFRSDTNTYISIENGPRGGSGQIYKVLDRDRQTWAIKLLDPATATTKKRKRFTNEMGFSFKNTHPNIVTVHDSGLFGEAEKEMPFYVMPYYPDTLRGLMEAGIPHEKVVALFLDILQGMREAHSKNVSHRDLKPENILVDLHSDRALVADFGMADFSGEYLLTPIETGKNDRMGNFQYAAPEQRDRGGKIDHRADIFALGMILNEMFTKELPLGNDYRTISQVAPDYQYLDKLIQAMLNRDPDKRPADIDSVIRIMGKQREAFLDGKRA